MSDHVRDEPSLIEAVLVAQLVAREIDAIVAKSGTSSLADQLKEVYPSLLVKCQLARLLVSEHLDQESSPAETKRRAADAQKAADAETARRRAYERSLEVRAQVAKSEAALAEARDGLARAKHEHQQIEKGGSPRDLVLAEGSLQLWTGRVARAEATLNDLRKAASDGK